MRNANVSPDRPFKTNLGVRLLAMAIALFVVANPQRCQSHARSLLSMPRLKSASSRVRSSIYGQTRIAQISLGLNGALWPTSLPLFHGSRRCRDDRVSMWHLPSRKKPKADDSASVPPGPRQVAWAHAYAMKSQPASLSSTQAARTQLGRGPLHALTEYSVAR
jgi:hypothetical protein